jgi:transcriptional regulator with XRE-family HTH domain
MIKARTRAGLTQAGLAKRMRTTQTVVARLESGRTKPSTRTLERLARATGSRLVISFEPALPRG